jgi:hypothetical protein
VQDALDTDLDTYLERELVAQPTSKVKSAPGAEKPAERLQSVLALAAEEEQWLHKLPPPEQPAGNSQGLEGGACEIPEHLREKSAPEVSAAPHVEPPRFEAPRDPPLALLPGLAVVPHLAQPGWTLPVAPSRTPWVVTGALVGVSAASVLVAAMLWMTRDTPPDKAQVVAVHAPAGLVTEVAPRPAMPIPESVLSVKDSPLPRKPEPLLADWSAAAGGAVETLPGPVGPGSVTSPTPKAVVEAVKPREVVQAKRARVTQEQQVRRDIEDPTLKDTEEELPFMQESVAARAPAVVAKAAPPPAPRKPSGYEDFDEDFARELGFTEDSVRKVPESKGVKSVWIPPDPAENLPQTLRPEDVQTVVAANQPAITSCIRRHKDAIPGLNGGKFVMRWFIHPSGSTYQVAMENQTLQGTALATCIEDVVRGWKFPKHRTQMGPIRFPFIF